MKLWKVISNQGCKTGQNVKCDQKLSKFIWSNPHSCKQYAWAFNLTVKQNLKIQCKKPH